MRNAFVYVLLVLAVALWGMALVWTNQLMLMGAGPITAVSLRMCFAGLLLGLFALISKRVQKIDWRDIKWFLLLALAEPFLYFTFSTCGMAATQSPMVTSVIESSIPVFMLIASILFFKERFSLLNIVGVSLTIPGVILMVWQRDGFTVKYTYGIFITFLSVFCSVGFSAIAKKLSAKYNAITIACYQFVFAGIFFFMLFVCTEMRTFDYSLLKEWNFVYPIITLAVLSTCVAFIAYIWALNRVGIARAAVFEALSPMVTAIFAVLKGQEFIDLLKLVGLTLSVIGVCFTQLQKHK